MYETTAVINSRTEEFFEARDAEVFRAELPLNLDRIEDVDHLRGFGDTVSLDELLAKADLADKLLGVLRNIRHNTAYPKTVDDAMEAAGLSPSLIAEV